MLPATETVNTRVLYEKGKYVITKDNGRKETFEVVKEKLK